MLRKTRFVFIFVVSIFIVLYGFVIVSSELPKFVKEKANLKVFYSKNPFNVQFETDKYIMYVNKRVIDNIKEDTDNLMQSIGRLNPLK